MLKRVACFAVTLMALAIPSVGHGNLIYEYVGNPFSAATGDFTTEDFLTGYVEFDTDDVAGQTLGIGNVVDYAFSGGPLSIVFDDYGEPLTASFTFDSASDVAEWNLQIGDGDGSTDLLIATLSFEIDDNLTEQDYAQINGVSNWGNIFGNGGEWTRVPEPSTAVLWSLAALAAVGFGWRRKRRAT